MTGWTGYPEHIPQIGQKVDLWIQCVDVAYRGPNWTWNGFQFVDDAGEPWHAHFGNVAMVVTHWRPVPEGPRHFQNGHGDHSIGYGRPRTI